ncbi:hypothetical protein CSB11_02205 [Candidatus Campbellbacteria bacterium]|nr:MAG: hypothetical protein CSB11_02205 [Candidatus Campbellbacteria bacterium]
MSLPIFCRQCGALIGEVDRDISVTYGRSSAEIFNHTYKGQVCNHQKPIKTEYTIFLFFKRREIIYPETHTSVSETSFEWRKKKKNKPKPAF